MLRWHWSSWLRGYHAHLTGALPLLDDAHLDQLAEQLSRITAACVTWHQAQSHQFVCMYAHTIPPIENSLLCMLDYTLPKEG